MTFKRYLKKIASICMALTLIFSFDFSLNFKADAGSKIDSAVAWAKSIANDDSHGYSRSSRWGPDYDCSSFVLSAYKQAGVSIGSASTTANMKSNLTKKGFTWYDWSSIGGASKLKAGDIVWKSGHTEMYIGNNKLVGAHMDYGYSASGDQNGKEISVTSYYTTGSDGVSWSGVLRYTEDDPDYPYVTITPGTYFLKNSSTGTYINSSSASDGGAVSLAAKKTTNAFKMNIAGSLNAGYYITPAISSNYVLNPYSDTPGDGTKITLYSKNSDGTQKWKFEKSGSGYIIHNGYSPSCVLTASGTGVVLKTRTGAANQIWTLESLSSVAVKFHRNTSSSDTGTVTETFTAGVANQRFGYKTDGTGRYSYMNDPKVGFGQWENPGYEMLGWSLDKNATTASYITYCPVVDSWIMENSPSIDFYAVWKKSELSSISVSTPPTALIFENGAAFSTEGMVVTANYACGSTKDVTDYEVSYDFTKTGVADVTISYTEDGVTKTAVQEVIVQDVFSGNGTEADPYQINTAEDLRNLANQINNLKTSASYLRAHYIQTADIDLNNENWIPIGIFYESEDSDTLTTSVAFNGRYNGNKFNVTGLKVDYARNYAGLFGKMADAAVVENLSVSGSVKGVICVGGITGELGYNAIIRNCSYNGDVTGETYVGGVAGRNQNGATIASSYANADVTATNGFAGGVTGHIHVGGNEYSGNANIKNCYFAGKLAGTNPGGIAGGIHINTVKECTITYTDCYYLDSAASGAVNGTAQTGCTALPENAFKVAGAELLGTPFVTAYSNLNDGYPVFEWQNILLGDVNNDEEFSVADAVMLKNHLVNMGSIDNLNNADIDKNNKINVFDFIIIKRMLTGTN